LSVVTLAHGSGGFEMQELLSKLIFARVIDELKKVKGGVGIDKLDDGALIPIGGNEFLVISIDSYTVNPPFFPGGSIGSLAAAGSLNDVIMMGGRPIAMLDSIVVEEGFPLDDLNIIVEDFLKILREEDVALIGGDFKVMPKEHIDRIVITTVALGRTSNPVVDEVKPGDKIIVSDYVGDHGAVIMLLQMGLGDRVEELSSGTLKSDVKPLSRIIPLMERYKGGIHASRDPTRGGLAGVLNEWAKSSGLVIVLEESKIPIRDSVERYSEMLGIDPLYLASEGVAVLSVDPAIAEEVLEYMWKLGFENARVVGEVRSSERFKGYVLARTPVGGFRIIEEPRGELVPRIC
jgi:hydrogenase expression/formation protein HypE